MEDKQKLVSPKRGRYSDFVSATNPSSALPPQPPAEDGNLQFESAAIVAHTQAKLRNRAKKKHKRDKQNGKDRPRLKRRMSQFERRYTELALEHKLIPERKRIDYVLVYQDINSQDAKDESKRSQLLFHESNRAKFDLLMKSEGFSIQKETIGSYVYVKLHCPFKRLCLEAERVKLQLPLKDCKVETTEVQSKLSRLIEKYFETDNEEDYVSSIFIMDKIHLFEKHENPTDFFRPSLRSFLTHHILINLDIRTVKEREEGWSATSSEEQSFLQRCCSCCFSTGNVEVQQRDAKVLKKKGLPYLLLKKSYTDSYILHEDSVKRAKKEEAIDGLFQPETKDEVEHMKDEIPLAYINDPRKEMDDTWTIFYKFQPLWKIRNYFGEKIAFYFAWSGMLITSLWVPTLLGLGIFFYGLALSIEEDLNTNSTLPLNATLTEELKSKVTDVLNVIKQAFDNDVTPFFALIVCLWGTVFLELWKRKVARLAYEWDVHEFESSEPDRPQFFGTKVKPDPITQEDTWFYPLKRQLLKFTTSASVLIFMIFMVIISVVAVIIYRVIADIDWCPDMSPAACVLLTTVVSSILNAVSILLLGKFYDKLAVWLTEWENHRTQTRYDDALIIKLFAFQFVNSYASCFYIAFFRGRFNTGAIIGRDASYMDKCSGTCMSQLSFQVLVLMLIKPFPKFFKDIVLPVVKKLWRKRPCCRKTKVDSETPKEQKDHTHQNFLERERLKPTLGEFTLGEYTEKVIQYGFLMLFAASFPLAPLLALMTNLIDMRVDAKRMLWFNRRPLAFIAQDIGMWYDILTFVNFCGVLTNAFLIAFTSSWGQNYSMQDKLWIVIGFEHIVFVLKYILAYMIPDVPTEVRLAVRREKYQISKKLNEGKKETMDFSHLYPESRSRQVSMNEDDEGNNVNNDRGGMEESAIVEESHSDTQSAPSTHQPVQSRHSNNDLWYIANKDTQSEMDKREDMVSMSAIHPHGSRLNSKSSPDSAEETAMTTLKNEAGDSDRAFDVPDEVDERDDPEASPPAPIVPKAHVWNMNYQSRGNLDDSTA